MCWMYCPVALVFIDKYTQVPCILRPIAGCVDRLLDLRAADERGALSPKDAHFVQYIIST